MENEIFQDKVIENVSDRISANHCQSGTDITIYSISTT